MDEEQLQLEQILKRLLDAIPQGINKRPGEITYDILSAVAQEFLKVALLQDWYEQNAFPSTADMEHLTGWSKVFGLEPYPATHAVVKAELTMNPETRLVDIGTRFTGGELNYVVEEKLEEPKEYLLRCETEGTVGNTYYGLIQPIFNVNGLQRAEIVEISIPGEDLEDVEDFRERVQNTFISKPYGGNYANYYEWLSEIQGVGDFKVIGTPTRKATYVDVYFIDSTFKAPTEETVQSVQEALHPRPKDMTEDTLSTSGTGLAPIGHDVTVHGVTNKEINIETRISLGEGVEWGSIEPKIQERLNSYFLDRAKLWADSGYLIERVSSINSAILEISGIVDIWETKLNGEEVSLDLSAYEIPVLGTLTNLEESE